MTRAEVEVITGHEITTAGSAWDRVAARWENVLAQKSERTKTEYRRYMAYFLQSIGGDPSRATSGNVYDFAYTPGKSGNKPSPSTITVRLAALRSFYDIARRERLMPTNPVDDVERPRSRDPRPRGLDASQLQALMAAIPKTPAGARDRAAILTAVLTGLRRAELLDLTAANIEHRAGRVYYTATTKGGRERYRELPAPAWHAIRGALQALGTPYDTLKPTDRIFPIAAISFYDNLRRYAAKAGLEGVTPHTLRHSAAKLRRQTGSTLEDVGMFLGHQSLHTTSRYLARLEGEADPGWYGVAAALGVDMEGDA